MTCLITGCDLVGVAASRWVHGDLHQIGNNYVFNACLHLADNPGQEEVQGEAAWQYNTYLSTKTKQLILNSWLTTSLQFFDRRGAITFPTSAAFPNKAAKDYLQGDYL